MASTFCFTVIMLSHTFGNLATKNSRFSEWHVLLSFLKVMQNSSRFTNVSRLGKSELVTPTLFIWSSHAAKHSCWVSPTYKQTKSFITMKLIPIFLLIYWFLEFDVDEIVFIQTWFSLPINLNISFMQVSPGPRHIFG